MCVVAVKFFPQIGWCGVKNRDRLYHPSINIRKSHRSGVERLYLWDENTAYTEGLNEDGVSIINASVISKLGKADEKVSGDESSNKGYYSPDGKRIRDALIERTVRAAVENLINKQMAGNTYIFDSDTAYLLEGGWQNEQYHYQVKKIDPNKGSSVRTNHGLLLPWNGYQRDPNSSEATMKRISSEYRRYTVMNHLDECANPQAALAVLLKTDLPHIQLNPCRLDKRPGRVKTTGQLMMIPSEKTLYYRPIFCELDFDFEKLNTPHDQTFFEVLGLRDLFRNPTPK